MYKYCAGISPLSLISPMFLTCLRSGENGAEAPAAAPAAAASNYGVYRAVDLGDAEHQRQSQDAHVANLVTPWSLTGHSLVTHTSLDGRRSWHIQTQHLSQAQFPPHAFFLFRISLEKRDGGGVASREGSSGAAEDVWSCKGKDSTRVCRRCFREVNSFT